MVEKTNKNKHTNLKKPINSCKLQNSEKQKESTLQTNSTLFLFTERFCKNSCVVGATQKTYENTQQQPFFLIEGEKKALMQLERLKSKFINLLMRNGEKAKAYKLFAESLKQLEKQSISKENTFLLFGKKEKSKENEKYSLKKKIGEEQHKDKKSQKNKTKHTLNKKDCLLHNEKKGVDYYNDFLKKNTLYQAVENVKPTLELRRVRKGGTTYQVPAIVSKARQERLAIKWIIESAEKRKKKNKNSFSNCLVSEILDAFNKIGQPRQKRDEQLKVAEFNRAYTRYRWW